MFIWKTFNKSPPKNEIKERTQVLLFVHCIINEPLIFQEMVWNLNRHLVLNTNIWGRLGFHHPENLELQQIWKCKHCQCGALLSIWSKISKFKCKRIIHFEVQLALLLAAWYTTLREIIQFSVWKCSSHC